MSTARHMTRMPLCVGRQKGDHVEVHDLRPRGLRAEVQARLNAASNGSRAYLEVMQIISEAVDAARAAAVAEERWFDGRIQHVDLRDADDEARAAYDRVCVAVLWALGEFGDTDTGGAR